MQAVLTSAIWLISLACLCSAGLVATEFVMMPVSLDIGEMLAAGAEPWRYAALAVAGFAALAIVVALSLWCWHNGRHRRLAWTLTAAEVAAVGWCCAVVFREFF